MTDWDSEHGKLKSSRKQIQERPEGHSLPCQMQDDPCGMLLRVWSSLILNESADTTFTTSIRRLFHCQINMLVSLINKSLDKGIRIKIRVKGNINWINCFVQIWFAVRIRLELTKHNECAYKFSAGCIAGPNCGFGAETKSLVKECRFWKEVDLYVEISENLFVFLYFSRSKWWSIPVVHLSYRSPEAFFFTQ